MSSLCVFPLCLCSSSLQQSAHGCMAQGQAIRWIEVTWKCDSSRCPGKSRLIVHLQHTLTAQPHEHREYCQTRQLFSVVAEQCSCEKSTEMWCSEDEELAGALWNTNDWQTASSSGWWTTSGSGTEGRWSENPGRGGKQRTRRWQGPREEGARVRGTVLSSFASTAATNEQREARIVVPAEVPRDTGICIEDLQSFRVCKVNLVRLRFNRRGASTPLWGVEACSHPSRRPNPIPAIPLYVVRTPHLHGEPTTEETVKL